MKLIKNIYTNDMNIIVKKSIANNDILSSELEVNVGFWYKTAIIYCPKY